MTEMKHSPSAAPKAWPEVEPPKGWKKNPRAGRRLTNILLLTVALSGTVTLLSAGKSEVLPVICFLALVLLPFVGPLLSRRGYGSDDRQAREMHTATAEDLKAEPVQDGCRLLRYRGPYQQLVLPDELNGQTVTETAEGLLRGNRILAFVHLPAHLREIPAAMFEGCDNLPAVMIPPSVQTVGPRAFAGCTELRDVYITASTVDIAPDAFADCRSDLILHVQEGSAAERFAWDQDILCACR